MGKRAIALSYLMRTVAAWAGLMYLTLAAAGWALTGWHGQSTLINFTVNPEHNTVHAVAGMAVVMGAAVSDRAAALALTLAGGLLGLASALGFLGLLDHTGAAHGMVQPVNFLHLITGAAALSAGLLSAPEMDVAPQRARRCEQDYGERVAIKTINSQGAACLRAPLAPLGTGASKTAPARWSFPVPRSAPSTSPSRSEPLTTRAAPPAQKN